MDDLATQHCTPSRGEAPLPPEDLPRYLAAADGWRVSEDGRMITREYRFPDFAEAMFFVNLVGALAEAEGHHPDIAFGWGYAALALTTHAIGGLHANDFIMAAKINALI